MNRDEERKPMMADHEIGMVDDLLREYKPKVCFEFGAGNSTLYFPKKHNFIKQWIAVEHSLRFLKYVSSHIKKRGMVGRVSVVQVKDDQNYTSSIRLMGVKYDFILIDGKQREECLEEARKAIKKSGIILLHDSSRVEYRPWIKKHPHEDICRGERTGDEYNLGLTLFKI